MGVWSVKTLFLPPNTTSIIQPMYQGVLDPMKKRYKRKLLAHIIIENESSDLSVPDILRKVTMKDVVYWISAAWDEASNDSLRKAWRNLLPETRASEASGTSSSSEEQCSEELIYDEVEMVVSLGCDFQRDVAEWIDSDTNNAGYQIMEEDEIVAYVREKDGSLSGNSEEEDIADDLYPTVTPLEAFNALDTSLQWLESQGTDPDHLLLVKKWHDTAARMRQESLKQTKITKYFPECH